MPIIFNSDERYFWRSIRSKNSVENRISKRKVFQQSFVLGGNF